jgi:hypothetical protein
MLKIVARISKVQSFILLGNFFAHIFCVISLFCDISFLFDQQVFAWGTLRLTILDFSVFGGFFLLW